MSFTDEITFHGFQISAQAHQADGDLWVGSYLIAKDGQQIRSRDSVARHKSEAGAESGALLKGIQFADLVKACQRAAKCALPKKITKDGYCFTLLSWKARTLVFLSN